MIEITTTRRPGAKIALAVLNTGHPGPMPRGLPEIGAHNFVTSHERRKLCREVTHIEVCLHCELLTNSGLCFN